MYALTRAPLLHRPARAAHDRYEYELLYLYMDGAFIDGAAIDKWVLPPAVLPDHSDAAIVVTVAGEDHDILSWPERARHRPRHDARLCS